MQESAGKEKAKVAERGDSNGDDFENVNIGNQSGFRRETRSRARANEVDHDTEGASVEFEEDGVTIRI